MFFLCHRGLVFALEPVSLWMGPVCVHLEATKVSEGGKANFDNGECVPQQIPAKSRKAWWETSFQK